MADREQESVIAAVVVESRAADDAGYFILNACARHPLYGCRVPPPPRVHTRHYCFDLPRVAQHRTICHMTAFLVLSLRANNLEFVQFLVCSVNWCNCLFSGKMAEAGMGRDRFH